VVPIHHAIEATIKAKSKMEAVDAVGGTEDWRIGGLEAWWRWKRKGWMVRGNGVELF
jgi:hypothetical protein